MTIKPVILLDNQSLTNISDAIIITEISEQTPSVTIKTSARFAQDGLSILSNHRQSLSVTVEIEIRDSDVAYRQEILSQIRKWCKGSQLEINSRPGQRLRVVCTKFPAANSYMHFLEHLSITFTAYETPYWENSHATTCANGEASILGTADTVLDCSTTFGGSVSSVEYAVGNGAFVKFDGIGAVSGDVLTVSHSDDGLLKATLKHGETETSVYNKLTINSYDDLSVTPGIVTLTAKADGVSIDTVWSYRARWL